MAKKKKNWKRRVTNVLIVLLFLVGLILVFNKPIRNWLIGMNSSHYQINNVTRETIKKNKEAEATFDFDSVESISFEQVLRNQMNRQAMPVIGGIAIPEVGINLPIFRGLANENLAFGAGTMKENQVMGQGNYALASHNVTGFSSDVSLLFTPLERAKKGMVIYITDKNNVYQYRINEVSVVSPDHSEVIDDTPGKTEITLVTCADPGAVNRIIVHGLFEKKVPFNDADADMKAAFDRNYNQIL
ncbi:class A sortase [Lactococcus garvieae]|jgi:sortase A|uniref:Sortase A, LPXTG specific n=1 Tax=Lactococcus garvieae DCC43 TaxID=1231377 RepID=K2NV54_9LACT|nr:class A sortase [Lactococcus garvieae]EKF51398.1 Sortase A, LPXTG specific [Lactococcus garvieae DCC43]